LGPKDNWVTTLTFLGHVTSSVMWPFDSPYPFSLVPHYDQTSISKSFWDIGLQSACANRHCACAISRDLYPLCKIWVHIWFSHPHIAYSLWHFYWAPMKIKGCLLVRPPMLNAKSSEYFVPTKIGQILAAWGLGVTCFKKLRFLLQRTHVFVNPRRLSHFASKSRSRGVTSTSVGEKIKSQRLP